MAVCDVREHGPVLRAKERMKKLSSLAEHAGYRIGMYDIDEIIKQGSSIEVVEAMCDAFKQVSRARSLLMRQVEDIREATAQDYPGAFDNDPQPEG